MLFDAPEARKKDGGNLSRDEINDYIMRSRDMWPIWKRWDQLSSLGLLQHCNYSIVHFFSFQISIQSFDTFFLVH